MTVPSGGDRADFVYLTCDQLAGRYPDVSLTGLPARGGAGLVLASDDLAATRKALGAAAVVSAGGLCVPPAQATGTLLAFVSL